MSAVRCLVTKPGHSEYKHVSDHAAWNIECSPVSGNEAWSH